MKLKLPDRLFGRIYRAQKLPQHARMKAMWGQSAPTPPASYDVDAHLGVSLPPRMWLNNAEGDCVMAARANQETRFVAAESGRLMTIADSEVQAEYLRETGGHDTGLVPEDSLSLWQSRGWKAGGDDAVKLGFVDGILKIAGWGRVDATDQLDVERAIAFLQGSQFSFSMPLIWQDMLNAGDPWDVPANLSDERSQLGSWGGHQVYASKYDSDGAWVWTWGQRQLVTWAGLAWAGDITNQGEAQAVVRDKHTDPVDGLDVDKLLSELQQIEAA